MSERPSWYGPDFPEYRTGPPWVMEEMVATQVQLPAAIAEERAAAKTIADLVADSVSERAPIVATGCGTGGHAAQGLAQVVNEALVESGHPGGAVQWRPAFEATTEPWRRGVCIGVSHGGRSRATVSALAAARQAEARTALVTAQHDTPAVEVADVVLDTGIADRSWCHTIGYLAPIVAAAAIAACLRDTHLEEPPLVRLFERALQPSNAYDRLAEGLAGAERILVAGSGPDLVAARELALKISEGAWVPAAGYALEDVLHGYLVAHDDRSALIAVVTSQSAQSYTGRTVSLLSTARRIGMRTGFLGSLAIAQEIPGELTTAGRVEVAESHQLPPALGSLVAGGVALQRLTLALAHRLDRNPDLLRRQVEAHRDTRRLAETKYLLGQ